MTMQAAGRARLHPDTQDDASKLLARVLHGDSWDTWRAGSAATRAAEHDERAIFDTVAGGRSPPTKQVKELVCVVGRRGG
jgi:hypothetical protein